MGHSKYGNDEHKIVPDNNLIHTFIFQFVNEIGYPSIEKDSGISCQKLQMILGRALKDCKVFDFELGYHRLQGILGYPIKDWKGFWDRLFKITKDSIIRYPRLQKILGYPITDFKGIWDT